MAMTNAWTAISAGTMVDLQERLCYGARADVYGTAIRVNWSRDGTDSGASLFTTTIMPMVDVIAADPTNTHAWTTAGHHGPMLRPEFVTGQIPYLWETLYDSGNSIWYTHVSQLNLPNLGTGLQYGDRSASGPTLSRRPVFLWAMGK